MRRSLFAAATMLALAFGMAMGQEKPLDYTVKKGIAAWSTDGHTIGSAWPAIFKTLALMGYKAKMSDRDGGILEAIYDSAGASLMNLEEKDMSAVSIIAAEAAGALKLTVKWKWGVGSPANAKKFYQKFFAILAENLQ